MPASSHVVFPFGWAYVFSERERDHYALKFIIFKRIPLFCGATSVFWDWQLLKVIGSTLVFHILVHPPVIMNCSVHLSPCGRSVHWPGFCPSGSATSHSSLPSSLVLLGGLKDHAIPWEGAQPSLLLWLCSGESSVLRVSPVMVCSHHKWFGILDQPKTMTHECFNVLGSGSTSAQRAKLLILAFALELQVASLGYPVAHCTTQNRPGESEAAETTKATWITATFLCPFILGNPRHMHRQNCLHIDCYFTECLSM